MEDDLSIPAFLNRKLSPEERAAAAALIKVQPSAPHVPTEDEERTRAWNEAYERGLAKDAEARREIEAQQMHREALKAALAEPAKQAFFKQMAEEREAERAVKAAAARTATELKVSSRPKAVAGRRRRGKNTNVVSEARTANP
jgi:hypothetical protein